MNECHLFSRQCEKYQAKAASFCLLKLAISGLTLLLRKFRCTFAEIQINVLPVLPCSQNDQNSTEINNPVSVFTFTFRVETNETTYEWEKKQFEKVL